MPNYCGKKWEIRPAVDDTQLSGGGGLEFSDMSFLEGVTGMKAACFPFRIIVDGDSKRRGAWARWIADMLCQHRCRQVRRRKV